MEHFSRLRWLPSTLSMTIAPYLAVGRADFVYRALLGSDNLLLLVLGEDIICFLEVAFYFSRQGSLHPPHIGEILLPDSMPK